ncbi:MAG: tyrosine-type recombinase/integrase, partial [Planctomycetota bacterium]
MSFMARRFGGRPERRGDKWTSRITDPRTGRRRRIELGLAVGPSAMSEREAEEAIAIVRARMLEGRSPVRKTTVKAFMDTWLPIYRPLVHEKTYASHEVAVEEIVDVLGSRVLSSVTEADAEDHVSWLLKRGLKPNTVRLRVAHLRVAWNAAKRRGVTSGNPWRDLWAARRVPRAAKRSVYVLTDGERAKLLAQVPAKYRDLVALIDQIGLRRGEAVELHWSDFSPPRLTVRRTRGSDTTKT